MQLLPDVLTTAEIAKAAEIDRTSVVELTQRLVRTPSRAGVDSYEPTIAIFESWFAARECCVMRLYDERDACVGLLCEVVGAKPGPRYVLDACIDTAPFGDVAAWTYPPASGDIVDGWLYGRGSSDSKVAAAIFAHLAVRLKLSHESIRGSVGVLLDADEHTGRFGGAKAYFAGPNAPRDVAGVMIGYPGSEYLGVGGRGIFRAELTVFGVSGHSGDNRRRFPNALAKAADLISVLSGPWLPTESTADFPLAPQATVTRIEGGEGFSVVPDVCRMNLDVRLTPACDAEQARQLLGAILMELDARWPETRASQSAETMVWPPYHLEENAPFVRAIVDAAREFGVTTTPKIAGPANIGNYLASLGIPAIAGYGVTYRDLHAANECIRIDTIPQVQATYHRAILSLLS